MRCPVRGALFFLALSGGMLLSAGEADPLRGGVLQVALRAEPKTLNPVTAMDAPSRDVIRRMHADLITIDRASQKTVPGLAEKWTRSGNRYRLELRRGVRFSDGAPFSADDVVFSFGVYLDERVRSPQRDLLVVRGKPVGVRKVNAFTVEFELPGPYAAAERIFDSVAMLPKHLLEARWKAGTLREAWGVTAAAGEMAGLGPFRLKEYQPGEAVVLERNPYYWKKGLPLLDGISFRLLADEDLQLARFAAGELDVLNRLSPKALRFLQGRDGVQTADLGPGLEYNFLVFNLSPDSPKLAWFGKREFREALSLATDREGMARLVFDGRATAIWGHVSPGNRLWYAPALAHPVRDVAGARAKLRAAGFQWDGLGALRDGAGTAVAFSILVSASSRERQQMAVMLQADFKELGIAVTVAPLDFRAVLDRVLTTRQFDTSLLGLGGGDADPNPEMGVWLSSGAMHLWNPNQKAPGTPWETELDELMRRQMESVDAAARFRLYARAQEIVAGEKPMVFLVSPHVVVARRNALGNFRPAVLEHQTLWNCDSLYLSKPGTGR